MAFFGCRVMSVRSDGMGRRPGRARGRAYRPVLHSDRRPQWLCSGALAAADALIRATLAGTGIAIVAIRHSHHFSALWPDVEPFAVAGYMAVSAVNGLAKVVPHGGRRRFTGRIPLPSPCRSRRPPLVVDQATSVMARGDVQLHALSRKPVPAGPAWTETATHLRTPCDLGRRGTEQLRRLKGSSIALFVEILAAAVTGGQFSFENRLHGLSRGTDPKGGQLLIVIDANWGTRPISTLDWRFFAPVGRRWSAETCRARAASQIAPRLSVSAFQSPRVPAATSDIGWRGFVKSKAVVLIKRIAA